MEIEKTGKQIVDIAFKIHSTLGPGLLERVYETCFCHELDKRGIQYLHQQRIPIIYDGIVFKDALRLDLLIEDSIIVELKSHEINHPVWEAQLLTYMKLTDKKLGYLINFNVPVIKQGIKRMILHQ